MFVLPNIYTHIHQTYIFKVQNQTCNRNCSFPTAETIIYSLVAVGSSGILKAKQKLDKVAALILQNFQN